MISYIFTFIVYWTGYPVPIETRHLIITKHNLCSVCREFSVIKMYVQNVWKKYPYLTLKRYIKQVDYGQILP